MISIKVNDYIILGYKVHNVIYKTQHTDGLTAAKQDNLIRIYIAIGVLPLKKKLAQASVR